MNDDGEEPRGTRSGFDALAPPQTADDPRVIEEILRYRDARARGESPDRRELLKRYPQIADDLAACLDGLEFVDDVVPEMLGDSPRLERSTSDRPEAKVLGDFRLIREIGCGGMGIVYEAEQISLRRRVALKVLPFAATLDARHLQRFQNEAHAAASLKHPGIVGVYSVGCDRGVHYYAMEYVDGWSLTEVIHQLRARGRVPVSDAAAPTQDAKVVVQPSRLRNRAGETPPLHRAAQTSEVSETSEVFRCGAGETPALRDGDSFGVETKRPGPAPISSDGSTSSSGFFRAVAQLGIHAAVALQHAHDMGVVHRDIKPSNLMVAESRESRVESQAKSSLSPPPSTLRLSITDFGLAMTNHDPALTMTGDVLGTLRYMSPEQIRGSRGVLDHRTDIYSLGVTLYELLTLEPAFAAEDQKRIAERILADAPPRASRLNKAIPRDLETIVSKAMAFEPQARYASAQEMADDLRRFLEDKPIRARRASLAQTVMKWSRRHSRPVAAFAVLLTLAAILGPVIAASQSHLRARAEEESRRAQEESLRAEENLTSALHAVNEMYTRLAENELTATPQGESLKLAFFQKALAFYSEFTAKNENNPRLRCNTAHAFFCLGNMYLSLGKLAESESAYRRSVEVAERLVAEQPDEPEWMYRLAWSLSHQGSLFYRCGRDTEAESTCRRARAIVERLIANYPDNPNMKYYRGLLSHTRRLGAESLLRRRQYADAEREFRALVDLQQSLVAEYPPDEAGVRISLAVMYHGLSEAMEGLQRFAEAEKYSCLAIDQKQGLVAKWPRHSDYRFQLAYSYEHAARLQHSLRKAGDAADYWHKAFVTYEGLVEDFPALSEHSEVYFGALEEFGIESEDPQLGIMYRERGKTAYEQAVRLIKKLAAELPQTAESAERLGRWNTRLGPLRRQFGGEAEMNTAGPRQIPQSARQDVKRPANVTKTSESSPRAK